jgi:tRNA(Ile)-lysidine synthase
MTPDELLAGVALPDGGPLLVALSGGPDSAVAAWVMSQLAPGRVRAVHIHHGTPVADESAAAAGRIAERLGIPVDVVAINVPAGASWEGQARTARWAALETTRRPGETVVTGHHADDLAETTLGHLLRGAGAAGLAAMAADRHTVLRPLLGLWRAEVVEVAVALGLPTVDDPSNYDLAHTRNLLRRKLIPQLEAEFNPQLRQSLTRTAATLAADDVRIEDWIGPVPLVRDVWGALKIPAPLITTAPEAVAGRLVRRLLRAARPPHAGTSDEVAVALGVAHGVTGRRDVSDGWHLELEGPWLVAHTGDVAAPRSVECAVPGSVGFGLLDVSVTVASRALVRRTSLLDGARIGAGIVLRSVADGERIEIAAGSKPVRDVMAEAGVARRVRSAWPVAVAHGRIAAVVGIRSAPWARGIVGEEGVFELTAGEGRP